MRMSHPALNFCVLSALLILATIQLYCSFSTNKWKGIAPMSSEPVTTACEIWPGWRTAFPSTSTFHQTALPAPSLGTAEVMSGKSNRECVPARQRLGPFGHSICANCSSQQPWNSLRWGSLQSNCSSKFYGFKETGSAVSPRRLQRASVDTDGELNSSVLDNKQTGRTAVVLRTWDRYEYSDNQLAWMRAMITELSLDTGGRFQVFILVDVKDNSLDLFNEQVYTEVLQNSVPEEFRDMALPYNEAILREWFPKVGEYGAQDQMYQALQVFSHSFPEFDFFWQLEMDVRFTGNVARMLSNAGLWAKNQPRKNLWERNGRWYIPDRWDSYDSFSADVDSAFSGEKGIWGPHPYAGFYLNPQGPKPPVPRNDHWGIGEDAELITLSPLVDPVSTKWTYEHTVRGFQPALNLPRRMAMISITRTSRRLLRLISKEQRASGSWVVSESTPETWSLLHGLKAVYVPHLVTFNLESPQGSANMSAEDLHHMLHKGPSWNLAGGEHAGFLWCDDVGLPEPRWLYASYFYWKGDAPRLWWQYTNGSCTFPLVLHPVKND